LAPVRGACPGALVWRRGVCLTFRYHRVGEGTQIEGRKGQGGRRIRAGEKRRMEGRKE